METLGVSDITPMQASVVFGLGLGLAFGVLAQTTEFCLRRAIAGIGHERSAARGVWASALLSSLLGTQFLLAYAPLSLEEHRFLVADIPIVAIITGGLLFGVGMILTRGCVSRLTVLTGAGNLRALLVLVVFAVIAHATLKGVLAPLRVWLGSFSWTSPVGSSLVAWPGGTWLYTGVLGAMLLLVALRASARKRALAGGILLGLLVPLGWLGTGWLLLDEFDPLPLESLSFTLPHTQLAFWAMVSSAVPAGFGVGLIGGVVAGALLTALLRGQFQWQSFESPRQTARYMTGGSLMAVGGVLAGGCTVGAGLTGVATLSLAAILALLAMLVGGMLMARLDTQSS
ncbi:MAG: YeeE/YedE family protein [Granulosicoccus sp.]|nr:YeeE/YedE family protein [Granulosicoccus sp.]